MTDERYDEIVNEAVVALRLDVVAYVEKKYPSEAKAFEEKLDELANLRDDEDLGEIL